MKTQRDRRLTQDYKALKDLEAKLNRDRLRIEILPISGAPPDTYKIKYYCKGYVDFKGTMRDRHEVSLKLPTEYPIKPPIFHVVDKPYVVHPHIWLSQTGLVCIHEWRVFFPLEELVLTISKIIRFEPSVINHQSPTDTFRNHDLKQFMSTYKVPADDDPFVA